VPSCALPWHIGANWRIRLNVCFLRLTRIHNQNGKSIGSAIIAHLTAKCRRHAWACYFPYDPNKCPFARGIWAPSNTCFLGPTQVHNPNGISIGSAVLGIPFVKRFALCCRTVVCPVLSVLSVTLVYCGQTVGWIRMPLRTKVSLGPDHIALDEDPAPSPQKGTQPSIFGQFLLWPNGRPSQLLLSSCRTAHGRASLYFTTFRFFPHIIAPSRGDLDPI